MRLLPLFLFPVTGGDYLNGLGFISGKGLYGTCKRRIFNKVSAYVKFKIF